jgi:hypothetical protein
MTPKSVISRSLSPGSALGVDAGDDAAGGVVHMQWVVTDAEQSGDVSSAAVVATVEQSPAARVE